MNFDYELRGGLRGQGLSIIDHGISFRARFRFRVWGLRVENSGFRVWGSVDGYPHNPSCWLIDCLLWIFVGLWIVDGRLLKVY